MPDYTLAELAALTGLSIRTIRFYMAQGLIASPGREGRATRYPEATLARLRLICTLRDAHQPLAEIRRRLEELSDAEVLALVTAMPDPPQRPASALEFVRGLLAGGSRDPFGGGVLARRLPDLPARPAPGEAPAHGEPRVAALSMPALRREEAAYGPPALRHAAAAYGPPDYPPSPKPATVAERSHWERFVVGPDIEIHVRRPLSKPGNRTAERLIAFARQLQEETK
jgi:DNA-binding transcriptional MerR regulator